MGKNKIYIRGFLPSYEGASFLLRRGEPAEGQNPELAIATFPSGESVGELSWDNSTTEEGLLTQSSFFRVSEEIVKDTPKEALALAERAWRSYSENREVKNMYQKVIIEGNIGDYDDFENMTTRMVEILDGIIKQKSRENGFIKDRKL